MPRPKTTNNKPVGPLTAFAYFLRDFRKDHKGLLSQEMLIVSCCNRWKYMFPSEKEHWVRMEEKDKKRYAKQRLEWEENNPFLGGLKRRVRMVPKMSIKSKDAPTHPLCAYMWFSYYERPKMMKQFPSYGVCAISKILGKRWRVIDPDVRLKYELMAYKDTQRYHREREEYFLRPHEQQKESKTKNCPKKETAIIEDQAHLTSPPRDTPPTENQVSVHQEI